jgi:hypothetical protein
VFSAPRPSCCPTNFFTSGAASARPWTPSSSTLATEKAHPTVADGEGASCCPQSPLGAHYSHTPHNMAHMYRQHTLPWHPLSPAHHTAHGVRIALDLPDPHTTTCCLTFHVARHARASLAPIRLKRSTRRRVCAHSEPHRRCLRPFHGPGTITYLEPNVYAGDGHHPTPTPTTCTCSTWRKVSDTRPQG